MSLSYQKFLLFGDSITEFAFNTRPDEEAGDQFALGAALCRDYTRRLDIIQRGFSGYTSRWALHLLPKILENERSSEIVMSTIFFGTNDSASAGKQRVDLPEFTENITKMVHMLKERMIKPILIGPALHDRERWTALKPDQVDQGILRSNENNKKYSEALQRIAIEEEIPFVNLYEAFKTQGGDRWQELLCDGVHYSGKGYKVFYHELLKAIRSAFPELAPENIAYKLPGWRDVKEDGSDLMQLLKGSDL
ncbi:LAME_0E11562g1_1 [Lachancea meyersii CBS 8951]|uniref:LAME_0E11562g1_1 n=1 Tax=Lachancea meyersii CBS 8951 TaxID=1266667 RepID=A0A1G4JKS0_9SACH|nr:LAME_0E11562g1_1 [Lachancea meyersii CBS 8951]